MILGSIGLLASGVVGFVFVPVYFDMEARGQATQGVSTGVAVANRLLAYRTERGAWPADARAFAVAGKENAPAHIGDVTVVKAGVVKVAFNAPDRLRGGSIEIETFQKGDRYYRACRGIGIRDAFLPASCRTGSEPRPVEPAG
jgi:hypothetical protein